jgi:hypothetical protein
MRVFAALDVYAVLFTFGTKPGAMICEGVTAMA